MAPTSFVRQCTRSLVQSRSMVSIRPTQRTFTTTRYLALPRKGSEDKDSINTEATEYSKSGTDDASAKQEEAAFDPNTTDPAKEKDIAGKGQGEGNPLEVSPANPEVSKPRGKTEGGAENSGNEGKRSGGSQ